MRMIVAVVAAVALAACDNAVGGPDLNVVPPFDTEVVLAPGTQAKVGPVFSISLSKVVSDSRCPVDAQCVWAGDAMVEIGLWLGTGPTHPFELNLTEGKRTVQFAGYQVTFRSLTPEPRAGKTIKASEYRARFRIESPK